METNTFFSTNNKSILNEPLSAKRNPFTACSNNPLSRGLLISASENSSTSWNSIRSSLLNYNAPEMKLVEQGLVTPRRRECLEYRQIRDKSYYMGIIYRKGYAISSEMKKLFKEIDVMAADESTYVSYKVSAQTMASEVRNLQDLLADYNMVDDFCNTEVNLHLVEDEWNTMKSDNEKEISELEKLFELRKGKELLMIKLEEDIRNERHFSNNLDSILSPELCERYKNLKKRDAHLNMVLGKQEQELRSLNSERATLEKLCLLPNNKEACLLLSKLYDEVKKKDVLFKEQSFQFKPHELDHLQERKRENKELLGCLLEEIRSIKTQIEQVKGELHCSNKEVNRVLAGKGSKLDTLKKRDSVIDSFLTSYPKKQSALLSERSKLQSTIIRLLKRLSEQANSYTMDCAFSNTVNTKTGEVKDITKQELIDPNNEGIKQKLIDQAANLALEDKLLEEKTNQMENSKRNKEEIIDFPLDVVELKSSTEEQIAKLSNEADSLRKQKNAHALIVKDLQNYRDVLLKKMNESELFHQLSKLEDRYRNLEQENFAVKEMLADAKIQGDYHSVKIKVMETLYDLNEMLIK